MVKKNEFVNSIKERTADYSFTTKEVEAMLDAVNDIIMDTIRQEDSIKLGSLGTFSGVTRPSAVRRNPRTGESVTVPEKKGYPVFKFSATAKRVED